MSNFTSYELFGFNLADRIPLGAGLGLTTLTKSDDGRLILVCDDDYGVYDQVNPTPTDITNPGSVLGFVLDIGIQKEKRLTYGGGYYFGTPITQNQSMKKIEKKDFNPVLFKKIDSLVNGYFKSGDQVKEIKAIRISHLLDAYNNSRLLFPKFYNDSYLGLMRILDAIHSSNGMSKGAYDFALATSLLSSILNLKIYNKLVAVPGYSSRLSIANNLFDECLVFAQTNRFSCVNGMLSLDQAGKIVFACFYSSYQYRNKFVHQGLPFPDSVKEGWGLETDLGTAYLYPSEGTSLIKIMRPTGYQVGDDIDIHSVISDSDEASDFQEKYFKLLPTWHYLKCMVREALVVELDKLQP